MIRGFTDLRSPLASNLETQIAERSGVCSASSAKQIPVIFSTVAYDADLQEAGYWIPQDSI